GGMDDFNKGKLLKFMCDNSGLSSNDIGRITIQRMHSFFDVDGDAAKKLSGVKRLEYEGREVRVNRDDSTGGSDEGRFRRKRSGGGGSSHRRGSKGEGGFGGKKRKRY